MKKCIYIFKVVNSMFLFIFLVCYDNYSSNLEEYIFYVIFFFINLYFFVLIYLPTYYSNVNAGKQLKWYF